MHQQQEKRGYIRIMFTKEEDERLLALVEKYPDNWKSIAREMGNRSVRQCKERYNHYLSPSIKREEWTKEEDDILLLKVSDHGKRWKLFEYFFKGRTEIDIRNRYNVLMRRKAKKERIEEKKRLFLEMDAENAFNKALQMNFYSNTEQNSLIFNQISQQNIEKPKEQTKAKTNESKNFPSYKTNEENNSLDIDDTNVFLDNNNSELFCSIFDISWDCLTSEEVTF